MRSRSPALAPTEARTEQPKQPEKLPAYMIETIIFARVRLKAIRENQPNVWEAIESRRRGMESSNTEFLSDIVCGVIISDSALTAEDRDYIAHLEFDTMEAALQGLISLGFRKENLKIEPDTGHVIFKDGTVLTAAYSQVEFEDAPEKRTQLKLGKIFIDFTAAERLAAGNI